MNDRNGRIGSREKSTRQRGRGRLVAAVAITLLALALFVIPRGLLPWIGSSAMGGLPPGPTVHVVLSTTVILFWSWALRGPTIASLAVLGVLFAGGGELLQALPLVDRGARLVDFGYNLAGIFSGIGLVWLGRRIRAHGTRRPVREQRDDHGKTASEVISTAI